MEGFQMLLRPPRFVDSEDKAENSYSGAGLRTAQQFAELSRERDTEKRKTLTEDFLRVLDQPQEEFDPEE